MVVWAWGKYEGGKKRREWLVDPRRGEITFCLSLLLYNEENFNVVQYSKVAMFD